VLVHEYVVLDFTKVVDALNELDAVEQFVKAVRRIEESAS
jgi:uncharacterized protein YutE (UPF0331/DUF86 family)